MKGLIFFFFNEALHYLNQTTIIGHHLYDIDLCYATMFLACFRGQFEQGIHIRNSW